MREPNKEEQKRVWEWCGLYKDLATDGEYHWFADEEIVSPVDDNGDPIIDLNNLFKWAVLRLMKEYELQHIDYDIVRNRVMIWLWIKHRPAKPDEFTARWGKDKDPALGLFWAIYQLIEEEK